MSDESWPELEACVCGGQPHVREDAEALHHVYCLGIWAPEAGAGAISDLCGRETRGNSRGEASAAWNAMQRAARGTGERKVLASGWAVVTNGSNAVLFQPGESEGWARHVAESQNLGKSDYCRAAHVDIVECEA